jgi:hypothetical protein
VYEETSLEENVRLAMVEREWWTVGIWCTWDGLDGARGVVCEVMRCDWEVKCHCILDVRVSIQ